MKLLRRLTVIALLVFGLGTGSVVGASSSLASTVSDDQPNPEWGVPHHFIENVTVTQNALCGLSDIGYTSGSGPGTLALNINEQVSATWSASGSVSASTVSAAVGFQVTSSFTVAQSQTVDMEDGESYEIIAYPLYDQYNYEVWYNPAVGNAYYVGPGYAEKPTGVCFDVNEL